MARETTDTEKLLVTSDISGSSFTNRETQESTNDEEDEGPWPVEPDGGIGDGAGPPGEDGDEGPWPVEPDGGIGDGAGPPGEDDDEGPWPVEPDGGIGDGAGPPGEDDDEGPWPVEPDGGIGDGARPLSVIVSAGSPDTSLVTASEEAETFVFTEGSGVAAVFGFDAADDTLDLSRSGGGFSDIEELVASSWNYNDASTGETIGVLVSFGDNQHGFIEGITVSDLSDINIIF